MRVSPLGLLLIIPVGLTALLAHAQVQRTPAGTHVAGTPNPVGRWKDCKVTQADIDTSDAGAPGAVKAVLAGLKARAKKEGWTFAIGYNDTMDFPIARETGEHIGSQFLSEAPKQNGFSREVMQAIVPERIGAARACDVNAVSFNWRDEGKITTPQRQVLAHGPSCGDCWNFAAVGAFESNYALRNNKLIKASEQYTLDCATKKDGEDAGSCDGANGGPFYGGAHAVFNWMKTHNEATEAQVPYEAVDKKCVIEKMAPYRALTWGWVNPNGTKASVAAIKQAICEHGGIVSSIYASPALTAYKCGVFNEGNTSPVDHSIVIIGWDDTLKAWLIKNSWSTDWGIGGFGWIAWDTNSIGTAAAWVESMPDHISPEAAKLLQSLNDAQGLPLADEPPSRH